MLPHLSIIVLSWNVRDLLAACLRSLPQAAATWWERTEVLVVDNASSDGSALMVAREFPQARLLALNENLGFSGGNNKGMRAARGNYIFLLNPDTVAYPGSIAALADYMEGHPDVGIVGPRLLNPDGSLQPSRRRFPTLATALTESTPLQGIFSNSRILRDFYVLDRPDDRTQEVDWLSGAALMCRRDALSQAGGFDPGYFMFSEEVDLCRRVKDAGWRVVYLPQSQITHYGGQSTGQDVPARHIHFNTSKARYLRLHEGPPAGRLVRLYILGMYGAQMVQEGAKWLLGHKRPLRSGRLRMYCQVLASGLREWRARRSGEGVLLITGEYPPARGGVGDYTQRLGAALREAGVQVRVLTRVQTTHASIGSARHMNVRATSAKPPFGAWASSKRGAIGPTRLGDISLKVGRVTIGATLRALRATRSQIAHIQYQTGAYEMRPTINLLPFFLRGMWGGVIVVTFHDLLVPYLFPKAGPVREWANRLLAHTCHAAIATNPEDAARLRAWGVEQVALIPIGSNIPNNPPPDYSRDVWRAAMGIAPDTHLLAYFGFLNSSKGLDDLLRALALLNNATSGKRFCLMMVGGGLGSSDPTNRATAAYLQGLAIELQVEDHLLWTGYLPPQEVSAALLSADMAVLPYADGASFRRGSLLAVLEHGLPVVTTRPAANSELRTRQIGLSNESAAARIPSLDNGKNALLVPPGNIEGLAEAILRLGEDEELRAEVGKGSRELARFFRWDRIAGLHLQLYRQLLHELEGHGMPDHKER